MYFSKALRLGAFVVIVHAEPIPQGYGYSVFPPPPSSGVFYGTSKNPGTGTAPLSTGFSTGTVPSLSIPASSSLSAPYGNGTSSVTGTAFSSHASIGTIGTSPSGSASYSSARPSNRTTKISGTAIFSTGSTGTKPGSLDPTISSSAPYSNGTKHSIGTAFSTGTVPLISASSGSLGNRTASITSSKHANSTKPIFSTGTVRAASSGPSSGYSAPYGNGTYSIPASGVAKSTIASGSLLTTKDPSASASPSGSLSTKTNGTATGVSSATPSSPPIFPTKPKLPTSPATIRGSPTEPFSSVPSLKPTGYPGSLSISKFTYTPTPVSVSSGYYYHHGKSKTKKPKETDAKNKHPHDIYENTPFHPLRNREYGFDFDNNDFN